MELNEPVREVSPYLQKRFLEWKSRKRVLQRVTIRPGWGDFVLDWIAWPVFGILPFILAYDNKIVQWLYIPNGYLCMMAAIGAIHTLVLLLAGYVARQLCLL